LAKHSCQDITEVKSSYRPLVLKFFLILGSQNFFAKDLGAHRCYTHMHTLYNMWKPTGNSLTFLNYLLWITECSETTARKLFGNAIRHLKFHRETKWKPIPTTVRNAWETAKGTLFTTLWI